MFFSRPKINENKLIQAIANGFGRVRDIRLQYISNSSAFNEKDFDSVLNTLFVIYFCIIQSKQISSVSEKV